MLARQALTLVLAVVFVLAACSGSEDDVSNTGSALEAGTSEPASPTTAEIDEVSPDSTADTISDGTTTPESTTMSTLMTSTTSSTTSIEDEDTTTSSTTPVEEEDSTSSTEKPSHTLRLRWRFYVEETIEFADRVTVENHQGDHIYTPDVESVEAPGTEIVTLSIGPPDVCTPLDNGAVQTWANMGTACEIALRAAETDGYAETDFVIVVANTPAAHVAWTLREGPPLTACLNPTMPIPDVIVDIITSGLVEGGGVAPGGVTVGLSPSTIRTPGDETSNQTYKWISLDSTFSDTGYDSQRQTYSISVEPTIPNGSVIELRFDGGFPGRYFVSVDDPIRFSWTFDEAC